jgi:hypothetical protein
MITCLTQVLGLETISGVHEVMELGFLIEFRVLGFHKK